MEIGGRKCPLMSRHWSRDGAEAESIGRDVRWRGSCSSLARCGSARAAEEVPEAPADLGATGRAFWERIWSSCDWSSPGADHEAVAPAARLMDESGRIARCPSYPHS